MLGLIWAQARDGVVGADGGIPWRLPEDQARFRALTTGSAVLMGRLTWDSLPERFRPLPNRRNLVLTRSREWAAAGAEAVHDLDRALALVGDGDLWVIGGAAVWRMALPLAHVVEVTEVDLAVPGDTHAPDLGEGWRVVRREPAGEGWLTSTTGLRYRFSSWERPA